MEIRTRFAPSPTGNVHIGNIRVAIYNWLIARHQGGKFLLRVEDTDRERSTPEAIQNMLSAMEWLGLDYDEEPIYQSTRKEAHLAAANDLIEKGLAYKSDFGSPEKGEAIVFKMPGKAITFTDEVKGELTKGGDDMKDLVLVRGDGSPVFHLANVVDDIHMGVNLVVRGDDHVENTFRHAALYEALGAELPKFAHLPMIVNQGGKPYSKRDGDAYVGDFKEKGYLPETLFNYLTFLGWNPGDDREVMSRDELVSAFSLDRVQSSAAQMDFRKLDWMNGEYLKAMPLETLKPLCQTAMNEAGIDISDEAYFDEVLGIMKERLKFSGDIVSQARFFFDEDYPVDEKQKRKRIEKEGIPELLGRVATALGALEEFTEENIQAALEATAAANGVDAGKLNPPVRIAVTGLGGGPEILNVLKLLGKERVVARLNKMS